MYNDVIAKIHAPQFIEPYIKTFYDNLELQLISTIDRDNFTSEHIQTCLGENLDANDFIENAYRRGVISYVNNQRMLYKLGSFYLRLDIKATSEYDSYRNLPTNILAQLDEWCMNEYMSTLSRDNEEPPTEDRVYTLEEIIEYVNRREGPLFLNFCDCRSLSGKCGHLRRTCITYKTGINTYSDRGLLSEINKEEAKKVLREADINGLMHTANNHGICNCCGDCCYLFRATKLRHSEDIWPIMDKRVCMDSEKCINCGMCTKRCHFGVFKKIDNTVKMDNCSCVGCGLCVDTCVKGALRLVAR